MKEEIFDRLSPEEKKQLALMGSMLKRPVSEEEQRLPARLDAYVDAMEKESEEPGEKE